MQAGTGTVAATTAGIGTVARAGIGGMTRRDPRAGTATYLMTVVDVAGGIGTSLAAVEVEAQLLRVGEGARPRRLRKGNPPQISRTLFPSWSASGA